MQATKLELLMCDIIHAEHNAGRIDVEFSDSGEMVQTDHNEGKIDPAKDFLKQQENSEDYMTLRYLATQALYAGEAFPELLKTQAVACAFGLGKKLGKDYNSLQSLEDALCFADAASDELSQKAGVTSYLDIPYIIAQAKRKYEHLQGQEKKQARDLLKRLYSMNIHPHNSEVMIRNAGRVLGYSEDKIDFHLKHTESLMAYAGAGVMLAIISGLFAGGYGLYRLGEAVYNVIK